MSLKIKHAILHVLDFVGDGTVYSAHELDLEEGLERSFVQRHLRRACSSAENCHGAFEDSSDFSAGLAEYAHGSIGFVDFSTQVAQFLYQELRAGDGEPLDVLVADFYADPDYGQLPAEPGEQDDEEPEDEAEKPGKRSEDKGPRCFAVMLMPRKQTFVHDVRGCGQGASYAEVTRHETALPSPTQKVDSYAIVQMTSLSIDFHDKPRTIEGADVLVIPDVLLSCTKAASSRQVVDTCVRIVADVAREYGSNASLAASKAKAFVTSNAEESEYLPPWEVGRDVFEDEPEMLERFEEIAAREELPERVPVRKSVANRVARSHRIRTDTGIEITFPAEYAHSPEYIAFNSNPDGTLSIELRNIGSIEDR